MADSRIPQRFSPRDGRPGDRRGPGAGRSTNVIWYVLGFMLLMGLAQAWLLAPAGPEISYSEFKRAVRSGQVAEVVVGEQTIRGTYKRETDGHLSFSAARIEDPKL